MPPHDNHRLSSPNAGRKPLRSSPLAGPVISRQKTGDGRSVFLTTCSTPNLPSLQNDRPGQPSRDKTSYTFHLFLRSTTSLGGQSENSVSNSKPKRLLKLRKARRSPPDSPKPFPQSAPLPDKTIPAPPITTRCPTIARAEDSWLTFSPFAEIPRFNRLGIGAPNVVMPLSAKEYHRRRQRQSASPATPAFPPPVHNSRPPSQSFSEIYKSPPPPSILKLTSQSETNSPSVPQRVQSRQRVPSLSRSSSDDSSEYSLPGSPVEERARPHATRPAGLKPRGPPTLTAEIPVSRLPVLRPKRRIMEYPKIKISPSSEDGDDQRTLSLWSDEDQDGASRISQWEEKVHWPKDRGHRKVSLGSLIRTLSGRR